MTVLELRPAEKGLTALVGDIGGTNARLALATMQAGRPVLSAAQTLPCAAYDGLTAVLSAYLKTHSPNATPDLACLAVAGAVVDGAVTMTNLGWKISEGEIERLGVGKALLINDFQALAPAASLLAGADLHPVGPLTQPGRGHLAILGPGTGLGVSLLAREGERSIAVGSEGGHVSFAPTDELEVELWRILAARFGRVSAERLICGPGLVNLHHAMGQVAGTPAPQTEAPAIVRDARAGDAAAAASVKRFFGLLAAFAGDIALVSQAKGGVFIGGGMTPSMLDLLDPAEFRARFEAKGRFEGLMKAIPTLVIMRGDAALLGAAKTAFERLPSAT